MSRRSMVIGAVALVVVLVGVGVTQAVGYAQETAEDCRAAAEHQSAESAGANTGLSVTGVERSQRRNGSSQSETRDAGGCCIAGGIAMENMRIWVTSDVPEKALAELDQLKGISAGNGLINGAGEPRPEEGSILLFYQSDEGKGEIRIPFSCIAIADEGVVRATMKRTGAITG